MPEKLPPIFDAIPPEKLAAALRQFKKVSVDYGVTLMEEGDDDPSLICIIDGEVEIRTGKVELGKAGPGDLIGEMAVFGHGMRMATVRTSSPCTFLILDRSGYEALRDAGNPVGKAIEDVALGLLNQRLRDINGRIARLAEGTAAAAATPAQGIMSRVSKLFGGSGGRGRASGVDGAAVLARSPLFTGAPVAALTELASHMSALSFSTGHFLCTQGEYGREMFVLADGEVEVLTALDQERVERLATLEPGDAFGMVSLLEEMPRMASCVAKGRVVALGLDTDDFRELVAAEGGAGSVLRSAIIKGLIDQLAYANGQLAMLDHEKKQRTGGFLTPLLKANAGIEAHGRHLHNPEQTD